MRFVTKTIHAWLDYPVALALVALPFLLGLGESHPLALVISPVVGAAAFVLTVFTNHHLGIVRILPYRFHLAFDLVVGVLFLILPVHLEFFGLDAAFYLVNGVAVVVVIGLSKPEEGLATA